MRSARRYEGVSGMTLPNSHFEYSSNTVSPKTIRLKRDGVIAGLRRQPPTEAFIELLYKPPEVRRPHEHVAVELLEAFDNHVIFEDELLLVLNKPAGIATHYTRYVPIGLAEVVREVRGPEVHYAHRLDKDTSGVLVFAKTFPALVEMAEQFGNKRSGMEKHYAALLDGEFEDGNRFEVVGDIYPVRNYGMRFVIDGTQAPPEAQRKSTHTFFQPVELYHTASEQPEPRSLTDVQILTGRTHQIRVVAAQALGMPVTGDQLYNHDASGAPRQMLHSARLVYTHPMLRDEQEVTASLPLDFENVIDKLEFVRDY